MRLMLDVRVVKGELLVGKGSKVAKRLEIGPSEWESAVPVVVVRAERVERMAPVMKVAKKVDGVEVVLVWSQVPASEVVLGRRVCESRRIRWRMCWHVMWPRRSRRLR